MKILLIFIGGGAGALTRYFISGVIQSLGQESFPFGTLGVNSLGCFIFGLLAAIFSGPYIIASEYRVAVLVGFLGAMTTFSSFSWETFALLRDSEYQLAFINIILTNVLSLGGVILGYRIAEYFTGARL
ncbi:MAG: fluoride efflux transporter CrcB [Candidatus Dadabacteria bacterium]|nr:MAG: fluoride efflux transporter CrcB [Candidatus Dadabacteria bacterium]